MYVLFLVGFFANCHSFSELIIHWRRSWSYFQNRFSVTARMGQRNNHWLCKSNFSGASCLFTNFHVFTDNNMLWMCFLFCVHHLFSVSAPTGYRDHHCWFKSHLMLASSFLGICFSHQHLDAVGKLFSCVHVRFSVGAHMVQCNQHRLYNLFSLWIVVTL